MLHFFKAGHDPVRWEFTEIERGGPYRLAMHHSHGIIVEYFRTSRAALVRIQELEELLVQARAFDDRALRRSAS